MLQPLREGDTLKATRLDRLSATDPARALRVESVDCPAIGKVRTERMTVRSRLMGALAAGRRPDRPVPPMAGTAAIGGSCICRPPPSRRAGPVLDERRPDRHRLPSAAGLTAGVVGG